MESTGQLMSAKIHIERMMHRASIAVMGETAATYALLKLIPSGEGANRRLRLNLALVLDISGSMYEEDGTNRSRLSRVQEAAIAAISKLQPEDTLAIIAFAQNAQLLLRSTPLAQRDQIVEVIRRVDQYEVDQNGTSMNQGIELALAELQRSAGPGIVSQMVVLTDGETSGEQPCRQLAQRAAQSKIHLTLMGIGTDWKAEFIKELATLGEGKWYYIDVTAADEAQRIFAEEFQQLSATGFTNVAIHLRPVKDVKVKRVRQVSPEIRELPLAEPESRHFVASLGTLERGKTSRSILELSLPKRADGNYVIAQVVVTYDLGPDWHESSGLLPLEIRYTAAGHGYINAEVAKHIDEVQIFELNANLQRAITTENQAEVQRLAENIAKKGALMGPRANKKTMLAKQVLHELNAGGRVSKKTQLAVDDAARLAQGV